MLFKILCTSVIILLASSGSTVAIDCSRNTDIPIHKLEQSLLCNYAEYDSRPVKNNATVTEVDVVFRPVLLGIVDDKDVLKVVGLLEMTWKDEYLTWNTSSYYGINKLQLDIFDIWKPKLTTANGYRRTKIITRQGIISLRRYGISWYDYVEELDSYNYKEITVQNDGTVKAKVIATLYGPCSYDITLWPFDIWTCNITLGRRREEDNFVVVKFKNETALQLSDIKNNNLEWDILHVSDPAKEDLGNTEYIEILFTLKRHLTSFMSIFIVPGYVITLVSILPYWLATRIVCRLVVHFLCISIQIFLLQYVFFMMKNGASYKLNITAFFIDCFYINIIGMIITILNARFSSKIQDPPQFIINFLSFLASIPFFGTCFSFLSNNDLKNSTNLDMDDDECLINPNNKMFNPKWIIFFSFIDQCAFYLSLLYISIRWLLW